MFSRVVSELASNLELVMSEESELAMLLSRSYFWVESEHTSYSELANIMSRRGAELANES